MALLMATALGFILLTANSILAIQRSWWGDAAATAFVIASYAILVLLFCFLRLFETAPRGSMARDRAKIGVWLATTFLTAMFSWSVVVLVPWHIWAVICFMGASIVAGWFLSYVDKRGPNWP